MKNELNGSFEIRGGEKSREAVVDKQGRKGVAWTTASDREEGRSEQIGESPEENGWGSMMG